MAKTSSCLNISTPVLPVPFKPSPNCHTSLNLPCKLSLNFFSISNATVLNPSRCTPCKSSALMNDISPLFTVSENAGYSQASYYTSLGLFLLSLPGLWSLIKRSTKSKVPLYNTVINVILIENYATEFRWVLGDICMYEQIVQKTFEVRNEDGKSPNQIAGEVLSFFTRNNFVVADRADTITFEGMMVPSRGQALFLTFCTCISLASVALVLSITFLDVGDKWYWITALSPLAGLYYWRRASRKEQIKVKMIIADDESSTDVIVQGDDEQVDQLRRDLKLMEKGMVYVKGILEQ